MSKLKWLGIAALAAMALAGCGNDAATKSASTDEATSTTGSAEPPKAPEPGPVKEAPADGDDVAIIDTDKGKIVLMFYPERAPKHVENFIALANAKFYDGTRFHRCIPGFMIQGGDPKSKDLDASSEWGTGGNIVDGAEKTLEAEFNDISHERGIVSMARSQDPNSASSQFFIMHQANSGLNGQYSVFGKVVSGLEVVDAIVATGPEDPNLNGSVEPKKAVVVKSVTIAKWPVKP